MSRRPAAARPLGTSTGDPARASSPGDGASRRRSIDVPGSLALLGNVLCWASVPVLLEALSHHGIDAWTVNGLRYPLAAAFYWPVLAAGWMAGHVGRDLIRRALLPSSLSLGGQILWALAPYFITAGMIGFLIKASVAWGLLGAMILFPEERVLLRSRRFHAGLSLALAGFVGLALARGAFRDAVTLEGVVIILGCSFFFGLYGVSVRACLRGIHPLFAFAVIAQFVSAGTLALMAVFGSPEAAVDLDGKGWALLVGSSVMGIGIAHVLFYVAIHRLGASIATSVHLLGPFVTFALANRVTGESMGPEGWSAGLALVGGGALLFLAQGRVIRARERG